MAKENTRLEELLRAWSNRSITPAEEQELALSLEDEDAKDTILAYVSELVDQYRSADLLPAIDWEKTFDNIQIKKQQKPTVRPIGVPGRRKWWRYAAAAIVFVVSTTAVLMFNKRQSNWPESDLVEKKINDITAPENNHARIKLADGSTVSLDSLGNGLLAQQGNIELVKLADGKIAYRTASGEIVRELQYNTLVNPRGSKVIDMILSDGSRVWLNAGSSVTYPVAFVENERKVSVTGEAYFEVVRDPSKPFYVTKSDMSVKVLGTSFNVNAFDDENDVKITLLEGSVKISREDGNTNPNVILQPGQQAVLMVNAAAAVPPGNGAGHLKERNKGILVNNKPDLDQVMAWKKGWFHFDHTPLSVVLRQFSRWYDVDVEYKSSISESITFGGEMGSDLSLTEALDGLKDLGVRFRIEGRKLIVMP